LKAKGSAYLNRARNLRITSLEPRRRPAATGTSTSPLLVGTRILFPHVLELFPEETTGFGSETYLMVPSFDIFLEGLSRRFRTRTQLCQVLANETPELVLGSGLPP
jgi:hypothetical protein